MTIGFQGVRSLAIVVSDVDRARDFYTRALGFSVVGDITIEAANCRLLAAAPPSSLRSIAVQLGDEIVELVQYLDFEVGLLPSDSCCHDLWFQHIAIVVSDIDRAYDRLKSFAIEPISDGPQTIPADNPMAGGVRAFKFRDSDRHSLELIEFPTNRHRRRDGDLFLGIDHSAIAVADTQKSLQFYRGLFGKELEDSHLNRGEVQAALDNLQRATVRVSALQFPASAFGIELLDYVEPKTGRAVPNQWYERPVARMCLILGVDDLEASLARLQQAGTEIVSPEIVEFPRICRYERGCLVSDPDGHNLLLVTTVNSPSPANERD